MLEVLIEENSYLDHLKLIDFKNHYFKSILVCIVKRNQEVHIPTGNFILQAGDRIYVTGIQAELSEFYKSLGHSEEKIKSVAIIGAGRITYYLTSLLLEQKMNLKIFEINEEKANLLSETYENANVVWGDGTDSTLLEEEQFSSYDACISLTGIDEENVILSMYANKVGIKKTITKINNSSLFHLLDFSELQTIVTPKKLIADYIIKTVRSFINSENEENIETLYRLAENRVEAIEFKVPEDSDVINIPLKNLNIKDNLLIAYIIRNNQAIFPGGMDIILPEDRVIIVTTEKYLNHVNKILK